MADAALPVSSHADSRSLLKPESLANLFVLLLLGGGALVALALEEPFWITLATKIAILGLAGVGLNLALGTGGLSSLGHAAFFGVGGYVAGILTHHAFTYEPILSDPVLVEGSKNILVAMGVAIVFGSILAGLIGALSLRSSGVYFIMITLAFAQMIYYFAISWPTYGGEDGLPIVLRNEFPGLNTLDPLQFFGLCFAILIICLYLVSTITHSRFGLALSCARQNETRLTSLGISPFPIRLLAFVISGGITALAGALFANLNRFVSPEMLSWHMSGEIMVLVILGGVGRLCGPIAGAITFILLEHLLGGVTEYWQILLGALLIFVLLFARGGIMAALVRLAQRVAGNSGVQRNG